MWELYVPFLVLANTIITHSAGETVKIHQHQPSSNCGASCKHLSSCPQNGVTDTKTVTGTGNRHSPEEPEETGQGNVRWDPGPGQRY